MDNYKKQGSWLFIQITGCLLLRLLFHFILHIPNIEPLFACGVLVGQKQSYSYAFLFGAINVLLFDLLTVGFGPWTVVTGFLYALLGSAAVKFWRQNEMVAQEKNRTLNSLKFTIAGTLIFDFFSGCLLGPLMFKQNFMEAIIGQVPFSILHVLGNVVLVMSIEAFLQKNRCYNPKTLIPFPRKTGG